MDINRTRIYILWKQGWQHLWKVSSLVQTDKTWSMLLPKNYSENEKKTVIKLLKIMDALYTRINVLWCNHRYAMTRASLWFLNNCPRNHHFKSHVEIKLVFMNWYYYPSYFIGTKIEQWYIITVFSLIRVKEMNKYI